MKIQVHDNAGRFLFEANVTKGNASLRENGNVVTVINPNDQTETETVFNYEFKRWELGQL